MKLTHLTKDQSEALILLLKARFEKNMQRHTDIIWEAVHAKLQANPEKLTSLDKMEASGGEPDVVNYDEVTDEYAFYDCSPETPVGRRSLCYDQKALESRKAHKPQSSAVTEAETMGIKILTGLQYSELQKIGEFDTKTSSWVLTPEEIRSLGGALFCDRRYNHVFVYHNGAESYYSVRGFRGVLLV